MKLDFQVGASAKGHKMLGKLAGRQGEDTKRDNPKAPFETMAHAYLFAFMLGLSNGEKVELKNRKNYANFSSIERSVSQDFEVYPILRLLGTSEDSKDTDSARKAIEEYTNWGLLYMEKNNLFGEDDFKIGELLESISDETKSITK